MSVPAHSGHTSEPSLKPAASLNSAVLATYDTNIEAENAVRELQKSGFDMQNLSIVGKDYQTEESVVGYYTTGDRMKSWGKTGAFWGGVWGLLFGSAFFLIPGVGPLLAAGPVVAWIIGALEGAVVVGGLGVVGGALASIGIPEDSVLEYEKQVKMGKYLVIAHGPHDAISNAGSAIKQTKPASMKEHSCCG